ncbi:MAG: hypothetical protein RR891_00685 [Clostridium sp.]|uniref:hypothetical protein n=1 Tax=Clostridium sp. TaxID=1506 RepID=UPI0030619F0C
MKKFRFIYIILALMTLLIVGCQDKVNEKEEIPQVDTSYVVPIILNPYDDEIDNTVIAERYKTVKKEDLKYEVTQSSGYFYESENDLVSSYFLDEIPNIDDKKYGYILEDYTYACLVNSIDITYDEALELAYKVLPEDIKKEREKLNENGKSKHTNIIFSSSKGNFIVDLAHPMVSCVNGVETIDTNYVVGITYLMEY